MTNISICQKKPLIQKLAQKNQIITNQRTDCSNRVLNESALFIEQPSRERQTQELPAIF